MVKENEKKLSIYNIYLKIYNSVIFLYNKLKLWENIKSKEKKITLLVFKA